MTLMNLRGTEEQWQIMYWQRLASTDRNFQIPPMRGTDEYQHVLPSAGIHRYLTVSETKCCNSDKHFLWWKNDCSNYHLACCICQYFWVPPIICRHSLLYLLGLDFNLSSLHTEMRNDTHAKCINKWRIKRKERYNL